MRKRDIEEYGIRDKNNKLQTEMKDKLESLKKNYLNKFRTDKEQKQLEKWIQGT